MAVTQGAEWVPEVLVNGEKMPLTYLALFMGIDEVATLRLTGYAPATFDASAAMASAGAVELTLKFPDGEYVEYTATRVEEPA